MIERPPRILSWILITTAAMLVGAGVAAFIVRYDQVVMTTATLRPRGEVTRVASQSSGLVREVRVRIGQHVHAAEALVTLDSHAIRAQYDAARRQLAAETEQVAAVRRLIDLAAAQAQISLAARSLEASWETEVAARTEALVRSGIESEERLAQAQLRLNLAKKTLATEEKAAQLRLQELRERLLGRLEAVEDAQARLRAAENDLASREVRSPVEGVVTWVGPQNAGEWIAVGATVAHVAAAEGDPIVLAHVSNAAIGRVQVGQPVRLDFDAFPSQWHGYVHGRVTDIAPDADPEGNAYRVSIAIDPVRSRRVPAPPDLKLGMTARAAIVTGRRPLATLLAGSR